jgi:hypothetical protein
MPTKLKGFFYIKNMEIKRIYHSWEKWEDYKSGFYNNVSGKEKTIMIKKVVEMFSSRELTEKYMDKVIHSWFYSCEQNLTNNGMNKIAYIGQAACCLFYGIPASVTMEAWSSVDEADQQVANGIADKKLNEWENIYSKALIQMSSDNKC